MGEAKRRRDLGIHAPKKPKRDWSRLNMPGHRLIVSARIDGVKNRIVIGWDVSDLAAVFPKLDMTTPSKMDSKDFTAGQESARQQLMLNPTDEEISANCMMLAYLGLLQLPQAGYDYTVAKIATNDEFYIHVVYAGNRWVISGGTSDVTDDDVVKLIHVTSTRNEGDVLLDGNWQQSN